MSQNPIPDTGCRATLRFLDSQPGNEEAPEQVSLHLASCARCAREVELRDRMACRLKEALSSLEEPAFLEAKIRRSIRAGARSKTPWYRGWGMSALVASVVVAVALATAYQRGHLRMTPASQESFVQTISAGVARVFRPGIGDHIHCAVFRKFPARLPDAASLLALLGPDYKGLLPIVQQGMPSQYRVVMAHRCSYHGRKFVHLALKGNSRLLSVILTRKREGESFPKGGSGSSIQHERVQRFALAGFETGSHLVYMVSDLDESENASLLAALEAPVDSYLNSLKI